MRDDVMTMHVTKQALKSITVQTTVITPEIAASWLDKNTGNRRVSASNVLRFSRDISNGKWMATGDSIKFDVDGNLIDGQHRLMGCVKAQKAFTSLVVYNLPNAAKNVIDTGKARNAGDVLSFRGVTNPAAAAAALRIMMAEKDGSAVTGGGNRTHSELLSAFEKHPNIGLYCPHPTSTPRGIPISMIGAINYIGASILDRPEKAHDMMSVFKTGVPTYECDPIHQFREKVLVAKSDRSGRGFEGRAAMFNTFKHAWNLFAAGESGHHLRWSTTHVKIKGLDLKLL